MIEMSKKYSWELKRAIKKHGFIPKELSADARYEAGKIYWNGYWQKYYEVIEVEYSDNTNRLQFVTVRWEDGRVGQHCTPLDINRDWELTPAS